MASWSFVLTDKNFVPQGEILNATERKVALPLSKLQTASFRVRLDHPMADYLMTTEGYLKAYRNDVLQFFGPIITAEESVDKSAQTVAVNCVGAAWILTKRLSGKNPAGRVFSAATDRAVIAKTLIDERNIESETHISTASGAIAAASATTYTAGPYKQTLACITDLSTALDGFDWRFDPVDNYTAGQVTSTKIATFVAAPVFGSTRPDAVFEWGSGRNNIASYRRVMDRTNQANTIYNNAPAGPDAPGFPTVTAIDAASVTNWGQLHDLADADILDQTMRQQLVNEHARVRANPRQVLEFTPNPDLDDSGRLPQYGVDFGVGDSVRARAAFGGKTKFDALVRVWGVTFDINPLGVEQQTLALVDEA